MSKRTIDEIKPEEIDKYIDRALYELRNRCNDIIEHEKRDQHISARELRDSLNRWLDEIDDIETILESRRPAETETIDDCNLKVLAGLNSGDVPF